LAKAQGGALRPAQSSVVRPLAMSGARRLAQPQALQLAHYSARQLRKTKLLGTVRRRLADFHMDAGPERQVFTTVHTPDAFMIFGECRPGD